MGVEEENLSYLLVAHCRQVLQDEGHHVGIVMLEEAEVCILTCELMREVRELGDLKELLSLHASKSHSLFDDAADLKKHGGLFRFA